MTRRITIVNIPLVKRSTEFAYLNPEIYDEPEYSSRLQSSSRFQSHITRVEQHVVPLFSIVVCALSSAIHPKYFSPTLHKVLERFVFTLSSFSPTLDQPTLGYELYVEPQTAKAF
jgi:hypothetical protein